MLARLIAKLLLLAVLLIIPAACSLTNDTDNTNDRPTPIPTSFVINTPQVIIATPTSFPTAQVQPTTVVVVPCTIPAGWIPYRVVAGDTLSGIARRSGTTTDQLTRGNCLSNPNDIATGQTIYTPAIVATITPYATPACTLPPRLVVGGQGKVSPGSSNALRSLPGRSSASVVLGEIPGSSIFAVLSGPQCADGYYWWQVNYNGAIGWTAEGQGSTYWLEPVISATCSPTPRLVVGGQARVISQYHQLRSQPGTGSNSAVIGQAPGGSVLSILAGPQCANGYYWWQFNYNGIIGWMEEGQGTTYLLEPVSSTTCILPPRLQAGRTGRVLPGTPNALRSQPGTGSNSTVIGEIPGGELFRVVQGPQCVDGYYWWQVIYNAFNGWTAEGQGTTYWTEVVKCGQSLVSRLLPNTNVRVTPGTPNRLRLTPGTSGAVIGEIPGGTQITIVGGPQCGSEGWLWWQINYNGTYGWTSEGDAATYWLEPIF